MKVATPLRLVEERNSSRNLSPVVRPVGLRLQSAGTTVAVLGGAALTVMSNSSLTDPPLPSLAVTFTDTVPTSEAAGVPAKVRVLSVKVSQVGSAVPSACVAA